MKPNRENEIMTADPAALETARLKARIAYLEDLLEKHGITPEPEAPFGLTDAARSDSAQSEPAAPADPYALQNQLARGQVVLPDWSNPQKRAEDLRMFFDLFRGRKDMFAARSQRGKHFPVCTRFYDPSCPQSMKPWKLCLECDEPKWQKLAISDLYKHMTQNRAMGTVAVYPEIPTEPQPSCRFLVFDFGYDGDPSVIFSKTKPEWKRDADTIERICRTFGLPYLKELSRSGHGAHIWIFFADFIPVKTARLFGSLLLEKAMQTISMESFAYLDRMMPYDDPNSRYGSLIALPLQGEAMQARQASVFVDEEWQSYADPFTLLKTIQPMSAEDVSSCISAWQQELELRRYQAGETEKKELTRPVLLAAREAWNAKDAPDGLQITLGQGIAIQKEGITPWLQNQIRVLACYPNPIWIKNRRMKLSNWKTSRDMYLGKDTETEIILPRGLLEAIQQKAADAGIAIHLSDERSKGIALDAAFDGELYPHQEKALELLFQHGYGIAKAATGFGKTVLAAALIARYQTSTLIIADRTSLAEQWAHELNKFLKPGLSDKMEIGQWYGGKKELTGKIDIVLTQSFGRSKESEPDLSGYGLVIYDECHHAASSTGMQILNSVAASHVFGLSATPERTDQLDQSVLMAIGPIRYEYSEAQKAQERGLARIIKLRCSYIRLFEEDLHFTEITRKVFENDLRNEQIAKDVKEAVWQGRTPMVLTHSKEHARVLKNKLHDSADHVFLLYGDQSSKQNSAQIAAMKAVPDDQSLIVIATGQKAGEGFSFSRLDTLFLTCPVSSAQVLTQYTGRLDRPYPGKNELQVYDYADPGVPVLRRQFYKRMKTYAENGWSVPQGKAIREQSQAFFNKDEYTAVLQEDLAAASKSILIYSPELILKKTDWLIRLCGPLLQRGVQIIVFTRGMDDSLVGNGTMQAAGMQQLDQNGIRVYECQEDLSPCVLIDEELVWFGGISVLGRTTDEQMLRTLDKQAAAELRAMLKDTSREEVLKQEKLF